MPNRTYLSAVGLALVAVATSYSVWSTVPALAAGTALLPSNDSIANSPFDFFVQRCLSGGLDFEKTSQLSVTQRWPRMTRQALAALAPVSDSDTAAGWVISDNSGRSRC